MIRLLEKVPGEVAIVLAYVIPVLLFLGALVLFSGPPDYSCHTVVVSPGVQYSHAEHRLIIRDHVALCECRP